MKLLHIITLLIAALFFTACASHEASSDSSSNEGAAPATGAATSANDGSGEKTAFDGATGSGLLMERYKSGQIEGFRD